MPLQSEGHGDRWGHFLSRARRRYEEPRTRDGEPVEEEVADLHPDLTPGQRVRLTIEGVVVVSKRDGNLMLGNERTRGTIVLCDRNGNIFNAMQLGDIEVLGDE